MKTQILLIAALVITFAANAQQKRIKVEKVPQTVQDALKIKYPDAIVKRWNNENDSYMAECKQEKKKFETTFSMNGKWINTATTIKWKEAPETVRASYNKSDYRTWKINYIRQIDSSDGATLYVVEADNGNQFDADHDSFKETHEIYISSQGEIIKTHKKC